MFGKGGMKWLRSIVSELSEVDQFIFDAELRHIETLKRLIEEVEARKRSRLPKRRYIR
jgi:hypothetical protein